MRQYLLMLLITLWVLPFVGCSTSAQDTSRLQEGVKREIFKEELKQEILAELRQQRQISEQTAVMLNQEQLRAQMKKEIEQEILAKIQNQKLGQVQGIASNLSGTGNRSTQGQAVPVPTGSAEGHILRNDQGLAGCRVKLAMILKPPSIFTIFKTTSGGAEFTTVTDEQGKYVFDKLPVGVYKLKWQLPHETGWIRRLRNKPDAVIAEGKTALLKSVETSRRLVGK